MNLGKAIRLCRVQRNLSQGELARRAEMSNSYLSLLERNQRDPTMSILEQIASALDIPLVLLLFLSANDGDITLLDSELQAKMSDVILRLLKED
jgi:transcriptional regulator with XRE-family HTH domain